MLIDDIHFCAFCSYASLPNEKFAGLFPMLFFTTRRFKMLSLTLVLVVTLVVYSC